MPSAGSSTDRRSGVDRRSGADRRGDAMPPLEQLFPHARMSQQDAADRVAAIEQHRRELGTRLGRNVGPVVAAVDYMLNITRDLVAPTIVEHDALEVLEHRSITDPLTGLFNRYHFDAAMKREIARCRRYQVPLSLLLLDLDKLKVVNDRLGHQAGDRALERAAAAIQKSLRGTDIAARIGGDEFAVILPDTDAVAALIVATRIRRNLVALTSHAVTASGGLVELPRGVEDASSTQLMLVADHALYAAKKAGGNCVVQREFDAKE